MSLLNDMLRDLARQQPNEITQGDGEILFPSSKPQKTFAFWISSALIFILVFLLALAIKHFVIKVFDKTSTTTPTQSFLNAQTTSTSRNPDKPLVTDNKFSNEEPIDAVSPELPKSANNLGAQLQLKIEDLLVQANRAMAIDRLTSPIEDNAYNYYKKILELDPNQSQAQQGLELIASHYLEKAKEQLQLGNRSQANDFVQRAIFVDPDFAQAQITAAHFDMSAVDSMTAATPSQAIISVEPVVSSTSNKPMTSTEQKPVQTESVKSFTVTEAPSLSVVPNASSKDEQLAARAQQLLTQRKTDEALLLLKNFIADEAKPAQSAAVLADIYLQQGNLQAAETLLNQATYLSVVDKAKINARLLSLKGNDAEAISVLEQQLSAADSNENYRALLASLYHKTGNYQLSMVNYQRLLNSFGDKPAYWLGLALAFDGLSQYKSALQAYKRLREFPQLQEQVKTYTDQRIAALRSE